MIIKMSQTKRKNILYDLTYIYNQQTYSSVHRNKKKEWLSEVRKGTKWENYAQLYKLTIRYYNYVL